MLRFHWQAVPESATLLELVRKLNAHMRGVGQLFTGLRRTQDAGLALDALFLELQVLDTAPDAPAAGHARLYLLDTGGKVELLVRFPTGAAQSLAIEP